MSDELTRLRLEVIRLQYEFGVISAENHKLRVMLDAALETKSRAVDLIAAAPEMRDALRDLVGAYCKLCESCPTEARPANGQVLTNACAALSKAHGK